MSNKAKVLQSLYLRHKVSIEGLRKAVEDGVITELEFEMIVG